MKLGGFYNNSQVRTYMSQLHKAHSLMPSCIDNTFIQLVLHEACTMALPLAEKKKQNITNLSTTSSGLAEVM